MPPQILETFKLPPGVNKNQLAKLHPFTPGETTNQLPTEFLKKLTDRYDLFIRSGSWNQENIVLRKSASARLVLDTTHKRYHAAVISAMEKRAKRRINPPDRDLYLPIAVAASTLAAQVRKKEISAGNTDFNLLAFVDCCLDEMEIRELDQPLPTSATTSNYLRFDKANIDPVKQPTFLAQLKSHPKDSQGWEKDKKAIAQSDNAVREFVRSGSRVNSLCIATYENRFARPLTKSELLMVRETSQDVLTLTQKAEFKSGMTDISFASLVENILTQAGAKIGIPYPGKVERPAKYDDVKLIFKPSEKLLEPHARRENKVWQQANSLNLVRSILRTSQSLNISPPVNPEHLFDISVRTIRPATGLTERDYPMVWFEPLVVERDRHNVSAIMTNLGLAKGINSFDDLVKYADWYRKAYSLANPLNIGLRTCVRADVAERLHPEHLKSYPGVLTAMTYDLSRYMPPDAKPKLAQKRFVLP